jgi:hypothetical protein
MAMESSRRLQWPAVIQRAAEIATEIREQTLAPATLRQIHYLLVSDPDLDYPNTHSAYKRLSDLTTRGREQGTFPELSDLTRAIVVHESWTSPTTAVTDLAGTYRRDRTAGQTTKLVIGAEKATLLLQLESWFSEPLGIPLVVLRGYSSQSYVDEVRHMVEYDPRPAVLLYVGDHDPSGDDILRDFARRTHCWAEVVRIAVTADQVETLQLPVKLGKPGDSRAPGFVAKYGDLRQVETEAIPPLVLRDTFAAAIEQRWDPAAHQIVRQREAEDRAALLRAAATIDGSTT